MKIRTHYPKNGFTLIELLVVMTITALIATMMLTNYRAGEKQKKVSLGGDTIIGALNLAQSYALTGKQIANSACAQGQAAQAYILEFTSVSALNLWGLDKCDSVNLIESYTYPSSVRVQANGYKVDNVASTVCNCLKVRFTPPFGKITISTATAGPQSLPSSSFTNATITLEYMDGTISKTTTIDGVAGRIGQ